MAENHDGAEAKISDEAELDTLREGIDDPIVLKEQLRKEAEARRQLTARAKNAEAALAELKAKSGESGSNAAPQDVSSNSSPEPKYIPKAELDLRLSGWSEEDAKFILHNGGTDALKDPNSIVSMALRAKKEQRDAEAAAARTSSGSGASEIEGRYTAEQLKGMTATELEKILPKAPAQ